MVFLSFFYPYSAKNCNGMVRLNRFLRNSLLILKKVIDLMHCSHSYASLSVSSLFYYGIFLEFIDNSKSTNDFTNGSRLFFSWSVN